MATRPIEALTIIPQYNINPYNEATNPYGFDDGGHIYNHLQSFRYVVQIENYLTQLASEVEQTVSGIDDIATQTNADRVQTGLDRQAAAESASQAASSATSLQATSATSRTPALGSVQFVTQANKVFDVGSPLLIQSRGTVGRWLSGKVTAYSGTNLTVMVEAIGPVVTAAQDWNINLSGIRGAEGQQGIQGVQGPAGNSPDKASAQDILAGTNDSRYVTPKAHRDTANFVTLSGTQVSMANGLNFTRVLNTSTLFDAPTGAFEGASGTFVIQQDGTGNRALSWNTFWDFGVDGPPTIRTDPNATDYVFYVVLPGATKALCSYKAGS